MSLPDLEAVLAEVWQLALTVSSLKHISGLVTQELEAIRASTGLPEKREEPQIQINNVTEDVIDHKNKKQENHVDNETDNVTSTLQDNAIIEPVDPQFSTSMTSHFIHSKNEEDVEQPQRSSMVAHTIIVMNNEDEMPFVPVEDLPEVQSMISMTAHRLADQEVPAEATSFLTSMTAHTILPVEFRDQGVCSSMVAHHPLQLEEYSSLSEQEQSELQWRTLQKMETSCFTETYENLHEGPMEPAVNVTTFSETEEEDIKHNTLEAKQKDEESPFWFCGPPSYLNNWSTFTVQEDQEIVNPLPQFQTTVTSTVKGLSFPLEVTIDQQWPRREFEEKYEKVQKLTSLEHMVDELEQDVGDLELEVEDLVCYVSESFHSQHEVISIEQSSETMKDDQSLSSMITHMLVDQEFPQESDGTLVSMAAHTTLQVDDLDHGLLASMVSHQHIDWVEEVVSAELEASREQEEKATSAKMNKKKSPSTLARNKARKESFIKKRKSAKAIEEEPGVSMVAHTVTQCDVPTEPATPLVSMVAHRQFSPLDEASRQIDGSEPELATVQAKDNPPLTELAVEKSPATPPTSPEKPEDKTTPSMLSNFADSSLLCSSLLWLVHQPMAEEAAAVEEDFFSPSVYTPPVVKDKLLVLSDETPVEPVASLKLAGPPMEEVQDDQDPIFFPSMVCHQVMASEPDPDDFSVSLAAHWLCPLDLDEETGLRTSQVAHQPLLFSEEDSVRNVPKEIHTAEADVLAAQCTGPVPHPVIMEDVLDGIWAVRGLLTLLPEDQDRGLISANEVRRVSITSSKEMTPCQELTTEKEEDNETDQEIKNDPRQTSKGSVSPLLSLPGIKHQLCTKENNDLRDSFNNLIEASNKTYNEKVADEYKTTSISTIKRIQELHKLVEEEIGHFETSRNRERTKSPVITTVMSQVKGITFPLEITIDQLEARETSVSIQDIKECEYDEDICKLKGDNKNQETDDENIVSATCIFGDNSPVVIKVNSEERDIDSGFEGSPNMIGNKTDDEKKDEACSKATKPTTQKRNSVDRKIRDQELLESFLQSENHHSKDKSMLSAASIPDRQMTADKGPVPTMPAIPLPTVRNAPKKARKPKITTTAFKESIMQKTYKIRFHVNLNKEAETEKSSTVLSSFVNFFKGHTFFGKK